MPRFEDANAATRWLERHGVKVSPVTKMLKARSTGLKTLGAMDYLINKHKYVRIG